MGSRRPQIQDPLDNESPRLNSTARLEREYAIQEQLARRAHLSKELSKIYGENAKERVLERYNASSLADNKPRLIEDVLSQRRKDETRRKEDHLVYLGHLNKERQRLLEESERLKEKKRLASAPDVLAIDRSSVLSDPGRRNSPDYFRDETPSRHSVHGVDSYIRVVKNRLPEQIERYGKLKSLFADAQLKKYKPYNGELSIQSYERWQLQDYHMVRSLVEEEVEHCLDHIFRNVPRIFSKTTAQALLDEESRGLERTKDALSQQRVQQLLIEELVLEVTGELALTLSQEFLALTCMIHTMVDGMVMKQAEAVSTGDLDGRDQQDPAFQLITKTYYKYQRDRTKNRPTLWLHSLHQTILGPDTEDEVIEDQDLIKITHFHITPIDMKVYGPLKTDTLEVKQKKEQFIRYSSREVDYWKNMSPSSVQINLSKKCQGVQTMRLSHDHKFLAVGTVHGDLVVYDLHYEPWRPLRAIRNVTKNVHDPILDISWSLDGTQMTTVNTMGVVHVWAFQSGGFKKADARALELKIDKQDGVVPAQLTLMVTLDVDVNDFRFQRGPFVETEVQKGRQGPTMAVFHPQMTLFGQQSSVCVALDNGDVLQCDLEPVLHPGDQLFRPIPKLLHPKLHDNEPNYIGREIPAELLRHHRYPLILMTVLDNIKKLVTVDQKGYINLWRYTPNEVTNYEWFKPFKKYKLDMRKIMYVPASNAKPNVIFTDRQKSKTKTRQEIARERIRVQATIDSMGLTKCWHREYLQLQDLQRSIYAPNTVLGEAGGLFHIILRHASSDQLSTYFTRVYRPTKVQSTKLVCCSCNQSSTELVFVLLYPEYKPKGPHLTILILDLLTMKVKDLRRDIALTEREYDTVIYQDNIHCDISKIYGATGSEYLFMNMDGILTAYSLNTGRKVLTTVNSTNTAGFAGCSLSRRALQLTANTDITVAGNLGEISVIAHEKRYNAIHILSFIDNNSDEDRRSMWKLYQTWKELVDIPSSYRLDITNYELEDNMYPEVYMRQIIYDCIDAAMDIPTSNGPGETDEEFVRKTDEGYIRRIDDWYSRLKEQVDDRSSPVSRSESPIL